MGGDRDCPRQLTGLTARGLGVEGFRGLRFRGLGFRVTKEAGKRPPNPCNQSRSSE